MTPEEEAQLLAQLKQMQLKLDTIENEKNAVADAKLAELRAKMVKYTGEKLDSFASWSEKELNSSLKVLAKNVKAEDDQTNIELGEDQLVPKLDSAQKEIPFAMRVNWTNVKYPKWS